MKTEAQIVKITDDVMKYLNKTRCNPMEIYVILEMLRHNTDMVVETNRALTAMRLQAREKIKPQVG